MFAPNTYEIGVEGPGGSDAFLAAALRRCRWCVCRRCCCRRDDRESRTGASSRATRCQPASPLSYNVMAPQFPGAQVVAGGEAVLGTWEKWPSRLEFGVEDAIS